MKTYKNIYDCIFGRRTIRKFSGKKIQSDILFDILRAGVYAPSACNAQGWKMIVISDSSEKQKILSLYGEACGGWIPDLVLGCSHLIVMTYRNDMQVTGRLLGDYIQSAAAALQNMQLMAFNFDIGSCWMCHLPPIDKLKQFWNIPDNYDIIAFLSFGYPADEGSSKSAKIFHYGTEKNFADHMRKYTMDEFVYQNKFGESANFSERIV